MESNNHVEQIKKQLRQINDYIVFHTQLESCITFIQSIDNEKIFFVSSISDILQISSHLEILSQIDSIFIFNWERVDHEYLVFTNSKLIGIYNDFDLLCLSIEEQVHFLHRHLQTFNFLDQDEYLTKDLSKQTIDLLWFQLYHDVLFQLTYDEESKQEMIDVCRSYYRDNITALKMIEEFKNEYRSEDALQWYLKKSFLYKIINKALRIKDFDQLYIFRYFMKDLTENFIREHQKLLQSGKEILFTYCEMKITKDQIEKFQENEGKLISINGFFSTNIFCSTALKQELKLSKQNELISVILQIQIDLQHLNNNVIIVDNVHFSEFPYDEQQEILFDSNVTFRLEKVRMEGEIWLIEMTASNDGQIIKEKYIKDSHRQIEDLSIEILFGRLMCDIGQWNQSQYLFEYLLSKSNNNNEDLAKVEYSLGDVLQWKGEWTEARKYYDHAYERLISVKPTRIKDLTYILFKIGEILYIEGKYEEARDYYERALTMRKENSSSKINMLYPMIHQRSRLLSRVRASFRPILLNLTGFFQMRFRSFRTKNVEEISRQIPSKYTVDKMERIDGKLTERRWLEIYGNIGETGKLQMSDSVFIATIIRCFGKIFEQQEKYDEALIFHQKALTILEEYYQSSHIDIAVSLYCISQVLIGQQSYNKALEICQRAMSIYTRYYPKGHVYITSTLNKIGYIIYIQGKHNEARNIFEQTLTMQKKYYAYSHINMADSLSGIGHVHYGQGKYHEVMIFYEQALKILQKYFFPGHDEIICMLNNIGYVKNEQGNYDEAVDFHRRALEMQEKYYPFYYAKIANTLNRISNVLVRQSKYNEALCYCQRALKLQEIYYPFGHASMASSLSSIGDVLYEQGKYNEAIDIQQRALAITEKHNPSDYSSIGFFMNNIGIMLCTQEKYDEALDYHRRALEIQENYCSSRQREIANNLNYIGNILLGQKEYDEALKYYQRAFEIQENYYPCGHIDIVVTLNNIGTTLRQQQKFDEAIEYHQKALELQEKYYPSGNVAIAFTINRIGHVLYEESKFDAAIDYYRRALSIQENFYPDGYIDTSHTFTFIGNILYELRTYDEAIQAHQKALAIREKYYEFPHIDIAESLSNIGYILYSQEKYDDATEFYRRSLAIRKKLNPCSNSSIAAILNNIGKALYEQRKYDESLDFQQQALAVLKNGSRSKSTDPNDVDVSSYRLRYFNSTECIMLANSSLGFQCEVLMIDIENRTNILEFINTMPKLRTLSIRCKNDKMNSYELSEANEDLIEWLREHLPSTRAYSINRSLYNISHINIWIDKEK
ncbi:unnamed protein product [Rotaria sordida]|uniref:Tetratricopeptide repeat protein n=2 Tax=Rotaria sordida TaxID=392033 RepID=A0A818SFI5_9BILA|nr:unnamed protein product [Rotaria sordida]